MHLLKKHCSHKLTYTHPLLENVTIEWLAIKCYLCLNAAFSLNTKRDLKFSEYYLFIFLFNIYLFFIFFISGIRNS